MYLSLAPGTIIVLQMLAKERKRNCSHNEERPLSSSSSWTRIWHVFKTGGFIRHLIFCFFLSFINLFFSSTQTLFCINRWKKTAPNPPFCSTFRVYPSKCTSLNAQCTVTPRDAHKHFIANKIGLPETKKWYHQRFSTEN